MAATLPETPLDEFERWLIALDELGAWLERLIQRIEAEYPDTHSGGNNERQS